MNNRRINTITFVLALLIHALLFLFREPILKNQSASAKDTIALCLQTASIENETIDEKPDPPRPEKPVKPEPLPKKKPPKKKKSAKPQRKPVAEEQVSAQKSAQKNESTSETVTSGTTALRMNTYLSMLRSRIERNKYYPRFSKRQNHQGTSTVKLVIAADGRLLNMYLHKKSGFTMLDNAALDAVRKSQPLPPPAEHGLGRISVEIPLCYLIN